MLEDTKIQITHAVQEALPKGPARSEILNLVSRLCQQYEKRLGQMETELQLERDQMNRR